ncbi:MAG: 6,7-dimethyl-8-ribityllumazine synthase, partial [Bacteroidaceae bacterium]|nr:6,7-dimethyl-8-ribityllumazine synthase [Bacteroidaceae bacterium]
MATELKNLSSYDPTKIANGKGRKVGIVYAEWNDEITYALRDGAVKTLLDNGVLESDITLASVPGSFELIFGASQMVKSGNYDAVIAIGCVIRGDTPHFDYICEGVTAGLSKLNVEYDTPVIFGLITTNNLQQAQDRSGGRLGNKGDECVVTALQMMSQHFGSVNSK